METVCDQVGIIIKGRLKDCGPIQNLLNPKIKSFEICIKDLPIETINDLRERGLPLIQRGEEAFIRVEEMGVNDVLPELLKKVENLFLLYLEKKPLRTYT